MPIPVRILFRFGENVVITCRALEKPGMYEWETPEANALAKWRYSDEVLQRYVHAKGHAGFLAGGIACSTLESAASLSLGFSLCMTAVLKTALGDKIAPWPLEE